MKILISRYSPEECQTIGNLYLLEDNGSLLNVWDSLELPWLDNESYVSCIPEGIYTGVLHNSPKFGLCIWIKDVPSRSEILIHVGNFNRDTLGCVIIGQNLMHIDDDRSMDVANSGDAIEELINSLEEAEIKEIQIEIKSI